jgi:hypothetical protein
MSDGDCSSAIQLNCNSEQSAGGRNDEYESRCVPE